MNCLLAITKNFDVACNNGSIDIKLEKPKGGDFDGYICMVVPGEDSSQLAIYQERYSKVTDVVIFKTVWE